MDKELAENQELLQRAIMLRNESEEIEKQLSFVSEQLVELHQFVDSLGLLEKNETGEMLASIGKGVHMPVTRKENETFFVEVGAGVVVRKTSAQTQEVVKNQIRKFQEIKLQLTSQLQNNAAEFRKMLSEIEKIKQH